MAYAENKRALFDYKVLEEYEAGIVLLGFEVKAIKNGRMDLMGSVAVVRGGELYLLNAAIQPYQPKNVPIDYDSRKTRKLLVKKAEIRELIGKIKSGLTLLPIRVYNKNGNVKVLLGLAKRLNKVDKREKIKAKDEKRKIDRILNR